MYIRLQTYIEEDLSEDKVLVQFNSIEDATDFVNIQNYLQCRKYHFGSILNLFSEQYQKIKHWVYEDDSMAIIYLKTTVICDRLISYLDKEPYTVSQHDNEFYLNFESITEDQFLDYVKTYFEGILNYYVNHESSIDDAIIRDKIEWYRWKQKQFNVDYSDCINLYKNYSTDKKVQKNV